MNKKVTMEDIAKALNLSRNTVIKALNNHEDVSESTKKAVIEKAIKLGYRKLNKEFIGKNLNIGVIMHGEYAREDSYWMSVIRGIQEVISKNSFDMIPCFQTKQDEEKMRLPQFVLNGTVSGLIIDGAINKEYIAKIMEQGIPIVLIDYPIGMEFSKLKVDVVTMECEESVYCITKAIIEKTKDDIGFLGDINNCGSFMERWKGFEKAVNEAGHQVNHALCILQETENHYQAMGDSEVKESLERLERIPRAMVCANDRIAINVIMELKEKGLRVPEDVMIAGFDNINESTIIDPPITTVINPKYELGMRAGEEILWRLKNPGRPYEIIRVKTDFVFRKSTNY